MTHTDQLANNAAGHAITDILDRAGDGIDLDSDVVGRLVADAHEVTWEQRDGLRRLVLRGTWEIDPAAIA